MPDQNKYEIRSLEVQEVLSTPPRFLTIWGNALVIIVLVIGLVFLSRYKINQTIRVPVQITETNGKVTLIVDSAFADQIKVNQRLKVQTKNDNIIIEGCIVKMIDTTVNWGHKICLLLAENSSNSFPGKAALSGEINGEAEIQIGKQSLLNKFASK